MCVFNMCSLGAMAATNNLFQRNDTSDGVVWGVYKTFVTDYIPDSWIPVISLLPSFEYHPWLFSVIGSAVIGLSGVFPLLVIPIEEGANLKSGGKSRHPPLCCQLINESTFGGGVVRLRSYTRVLHVRLGF